jgi:hypothetical protein
VAGALAAALSWALYAEPGGRLKGPGLVLGVVGGLSLGAAQGGMFPAGTGSHPF